MKQYENWLKKYYEAFDEGFPTYEASADIQEQIAIIKKCIEDKKAYASDVKAGVLY